MGVRVALLICLLGMPSRTALAEPSRTRGTRVEQLLARGTALRDAGDNVSSLAFYRDAISAGPRDPRGYEALARAYFELGDRQRALEVYEAGVNATGGAPILLLGLAETYCALGKIRPALDALRRAARKHTESIDALLALAKTAEQAGMWTEALAARRALLSNLSTERDARGRAEAEAQVRALEIVVGEGDRVRHPDGCESESPVRHALARCRIGAGRE